MDLKVEELRSKGFDCFSPMHMSGIRLVLLSMLFPERNNLDDTRCTGILLMDLDFLAFRFQEFMGYRISNGKIFNCLRVWVAFSRHFSLSNMQVRPEFESIFLEERVLLTR